MSSATSNTSLGRSRSLRVPAAGGLKLPNTTSTHTSTTTTGPSYVALFLTNLRLLDLDLRADWPGITALTFSTRDAQQNQKKRIQCVEWALFRLFELWDGEETRNKLQPFFPPLEQLQSLNLRAALFRCLDQAKKTGVLGRDTVLRKTMLDECKGERLEEVLAVFSNVVLKKVLNERKERDASVAKDLALENFSYKGENGTLNILILAHKVGLTKQLRDREEVRARVKDFEGLLSLNERRIARRREQLKEIVEQRGSGEELSKREVDGIQKIVKDNWTGKEEWLNEILYGHGKSNTEGLLATRFDRVWRHVEAGRIGDLERRGSVQLVEQLGARVKEQESRLEKWRAFGKKFERPGQVSPSKKAAVQSSKGKIDLGFDQHQELQVGRGKQQDHQPSTLKLEEYSRLIENMKAELAEVGKPRRAQERSFRSSIVTEEQIREQSPIEETPVTVTEEDEWVSESEGEAEGDFSSHATKSLSQTPPSEAVIHEEPQITIAPLRSRDPVSPSHIPASVDAKSPDIPVANTKRPALPLRLSKRDEQPVLVPKSITKQRSISPLPLAEPLSPKQTPTLTPPIDHEAELVDQILNSMATASPSPKKRHILSLAERTRLSMSRNSHSKFSDLHDEFEIDDLPRLSFKSRPSIVKSPSEDPEPQKHADLIERTRKSMAGFEAAQKKAQLERRRSIKDEKKRQRQSSYFPKVEEEDGLEVTPTSKIMLEGVGEEGEGDFDYDSVFKSRPRIKTSPAVSPERGWGGEE